jgi:hypothetical protein
VAAAHLDRVGGVGDRAVQMRADVDLDEVPCDEALGVVGPRREVRGLGVAGQVRGERRLGPLLPDERLDRVGDLAPPGAGDDEAQAEVTSARRDPRGLPPARQLGVVGPRGLTSGGPGAAPPR